MGIERQGTLVSKISANLTSILALSLAALLFFFLAPTSPAVAQAPEGEPYDDSALEGGDPPQNPDEALENANPTEESPGGDTTGSETPGGTTGSTPSSSTPSGTETGSSNAEAGGLAIGAFKGILEWIWNVLVDWLGQLKDQMDSSIFTLPSVEGPIGLVYQDAFKIAQPFMILGVLLLGIMMLVQHSNYNIVYATQHALPRFVVVLACLSFFPYLMIELSSATEAVNESLFPEGALNDLVDKMTSTVDKNEGYTFIVVFGTVLLILFGYLVLLTCLIKSFIFSLLYVMGPFVMMLWPIPATSELSRTWMRGTVACAAIPIIYTLQLKLAQFIIEAPSSLFGSGASDDPAWTILVGVGIFFIMALTPFWVINWALGSIGGIGGLAKSITTSVVARKIVK